MAKPQRNDEPRRVESATRVRVADEAASENGPLMGVAVVADPIIPAGVVEFRNADNEAVGAIINLAPSLPLSSAPARPWHGMDDAPQDGTLVEGIAADGSEFHMIWRRTSRHNGFRWVPTGFWSSHLSREPLKVDPVAYRLPLGFAYPGAVVA
jgi:hypothetical protein